MTLATHGCKATMLIVLELLLATLASYAVDSADNWQCQDRRISLHMCTFEQKHKVKMKKTEEDIGQTGSNVAASTKVAADVWDVLGMQGWVHREGTQITDY